ncbi:MAG: EamA family transporter [Candidatus Bathyarchaeum sp.]|nr:MAG: EamA family transporter [Candidatus Bathyarchaeum sp.]
MNNVFYKFLMIKKFRGYFPMLSFIGLADVIFIVILWLVNPVSFIFPYVPFAMVVGLMPLLAFWFYSKALMVEEISRITPLFQFIPIFVVLLSVIFLNEILSVQQYVGVAIILIASVLISYRNSKSGKSLSSALKFMIPFSVVLAVHAILEKFLLIHIDYWSLFFWNILGAFCGILFLMTFSRRRREFVETVHVIDKRTFFVVFIGEGVYFLGTICWLIAASMGYVSLVSAFAGLQHVFVFIYVLLSSLFVPKLLKEEMTRGVIVLKISAIALMFAGTWLVTA